jgi:hypothetical protein
LPASIEPEWYFWIFYFALASASSLAGGLARIVILFASLALLPSLKAAQCAKSVDTSEDVSLNTPLLFSYVGLFFIFFNRSRAANWHIYFLDAILLSTLLGEGVLLSANSDYAKKIGAN